MGGGGGGVASGLGFRGLLRSIGGSRFSVGFQGLGFGALGSGGLSFKP